MDDDNNSVTESDSVEYEILEVSKESIWDTILEVSWRMCVGLHWESMRRKCKLST